MDRSRQDRGPRGFVTAQDVARLAGVSRSAVSRTFTPGASVSADSRRKVEEAAKALGYRVNRLAQSLIRDQSHLVGIVGSNLSTPFMARQLDHLSRALLRRGMQCLLLNAADTDKGIAPLIELILEFRVRAIVVMSGSPPSAIIDECRLNGVRVILVNRQSDEATTDTILSDDEAGARIAAERLLASGCRRPALVGSGTGTPSQVRRCSAFVKRMSEAGLDTVTWRQGTTTYETGVAAADAILATADPDGVFCATDLLALGFLDRARALKRRVPDQLSVIGFDDIPQADWLPYRLTTIRQSIEGLTAAVVSAVQRDVAEAGAPTIRSLLPVELVERDTAQPIGA
jgi:DNA-binding LacI/PurR family transcriptional regulator